MKARSLWQISVTTSLAGEEAVVALLRTLFGQTPSVYTADDSPQPIVTVYASKLPASAGFVRGALTKALTQLAACGLNVQPSKTTVGKVARGAWAESWKKHFKIIELGRALLIKPSWSKRRPRKGQAVVVLDPGLSFGTGQHPTTAFCLGQILACRRTDRPLSFLDIGTGSGILAIAAAKLLYRPVQAFDNDPVAVRVATANAQRNRVADRVSITRRDLSRIARRPSNRYDLICANLFSDVLIRESPRILNHLRPGGKLVLAGIQANEFSRVQKVFEAAGLKLVKSKADDGWQSGVFVKPFPPGAKNPRQVPCSGLVGSASEITRADQLRS